MENLVPLIVTAHQVNLVVVASFDVQELVLDRVLESRVGMIPSAHQVNIVVVLIEHVA